MTMTPNSSSSAYCTGSQFVVIFDWRTAAELLSDTDTALTNAATVAANTTLAELLKQAAGQIEMATSIGNRYQPEDLAALAAGSTVMASRLQRLNAAITMEYLWRRRPDKEMPNLPEFEEAAEMLKALASGHLVFGFTETMDAGIVRDYVEVPTDVELRRLPSYQAQNLFGRRGNRIWP